MTISDIIFEDRIATTSGQDVSTNLDSLYCSHLWSNSCLRNAIITASNKPGQMIQNCCACKGKIRKYEMARLNNFSPYNHSTPNSKHEPETEETVIDELRANSINDSCEAIRVYNSCARDLNSMGTSDKQCIPSISHQVDSSFRHKYFSYETQHERSNQQRRLRKTFKGMGCFVNFNLTESPVKKRTQIQACSISVMIIAIVVISFVLVNFTSPHFIRATNVSNTIVVPTENNVNQTSSAITKVYTDLSPATDIEITKTVTTSTTDIVTTLSSESNSETLSSSLLEVRKNIRTYPKSKIHGSSKPKDIINRDISQKFCTCQRNEICMLDESSGTSVCRMPIDEEDPTGCGGLCALEIEACQLVDKARGVRVCRLLAAPTCSPQEWRCRNGLCVPSEARCDGIIQCYDRSDEMHCDCDLSKEFRCGHFISCFSNDKLCDGSIDCWDGYDELNCTAECPMEQFTCTDSQCIASMRFCDGLADCPDGSDEPAGCDGECGAHEIRCANGRCVARALLCDGHDHCGDASDEQHCPPFAL